VTQSEKWSENQCLRKLGRVCGVYTERVELGSSFLDVAGKFAHLPGTVALVSGSDLDCARHHILAVLPWMILSGVGRALTLRMGEDVFPFEEDPFDALRCLLNRHRLPSPSPLLPVSTGLFGYFSYDLKDRLERLPRTSLDDLGLPHIWLSAPGALLVHDRREVVTQLCIPELEGVDTRQVRKDFYSILEAPDVNTSTGPGDPGKVTDGGSSNFTREGYMDAVEAVRKYIAQGDVYQVNLSQRFQTAFTGDPWQLFRALFERNPAPFFAYIQAGDHQVVSTSPERFLHQAGRHVETRPIKGTVPRGQTPEADARLRETLVQSRKDDAELSMIVDLLRNDLGKVCEGGSVRVTEHKRVEAYQNVYHLVSTVAGELASGSDSVDLLRATFPGGSITGCPKIRAMEIIDELESHRRHVYTGSIGYISFHDTMDLSIAIRTATVVGGQVVFSVGGGIVIDSDPASEYEETLHKGRTLMEFCQGAPADVRPWAWQNGRLVPMADASVPVSDLGVQYGFGFFETIRVTGGTARHLDAHVKRFSAAWQRLFPSPVPDVAWPDVIGQVVAANGLGEQVAAVKILATRGSRNTPPWDHQVVVSARPYTHRLTGKRDAGLRLATYVAPRQTPLADYKTTNYLFYHQAGAWARGNGADEALILNPDGSVSETNSANILLVQGKTIRMPVSPHVLPGVMQGAVCKVLTKFGYEVMGGELFPGAFFEADMVLCTNALMGAVPVVSLDGKEVPYRPDLCHQVNAWVQDA
jgi:para-aminobenzoate synthetase component 1